MKIKLLVKNLQLDSLWWLCITLRGLVNSRSSLAELVQVTKERPETTILEILHKLVISQDTMWKLRGSSSTNKTILDSEDARNANRILFFPIITAFGKSQARRMKP